MKNAIYDSDLTDAQWEFLVPMLPQPKNIGRPPPDRRRVLNAILSVVKGGIPWRLLPTTYPSWKTVPHIFRAWALDKTWAALNDALRICVRLEEERSAQPTAAILDSQSVKSDGHGGEVGYDAGKRIKGRKRHVLVDTLGLLLGVMVTPASCPDRDGAQQLLSQVAGWFAGLRKLWVDGGYTGETFANWVKEHWPKLEVEVIKRSDDLTGFAVLPKRWIVERTFGWLMRNRRLVRDYERTESSAKAWIHLAMIRIQLRRLA
ncbi:MAG: IS5 family transposase [Verrucomicrobiota bacterium]